MAATVPVGSLLDEKDASSSSEENEPRQQVIRRSSKGKWTNAEVRKNLSASDLVLVAEICSLG
jgi:hypothetical protein